MKLFSFLILLSSFLSSANAFDLAKAKNSNGVCLDTPELKRVLIIPSARGWSISWGWKTSSGCDATRKAVREAPQVLACGESSENGGKIVFSNAKNTMCRIYDQRDINAVYYGFMSIRGNQVNIQNGSGSNQTATIEKENYL